MSGMRLDVLFRCKFSGSYTEEEAFALLASFGFHPEYPGEFYFDTVDNISFSLFEDRLYLDYYLKYWKKVDYIDLDIKEEDGDDMVTTLEKRLGDEKSNHLALLMETGKFKVLYYHDGGCAGAREVE